MTDPVSAELGSRPGKIVAIHLNYPSRAAQRGRTPAHASYFLKTPTSLGTDGAAVARPAGTELLGFEGEIALVIGKAGRNIAPGDGWAHVGWVTAANDFGLYDMRHADRGSNLRSKSADSYTCSAPGCSPAADPSTRPRSASGPGSTASSSSPTTRRRCCSRSPRSSRTCPGRRPWRSATSSSPGRPPARR